MDHRIRRIKKVLLIGTHIRAVQRGRFKHVRLNCIVTVSLQNEKHFQFIRYTEFPRVWTRDVPSRLALPAERAQRQGFGTTTKERATTPVAAPRACAAAAGMMLALTFTCRLLLLLLLSEPVHSNRSAVWLHCDHPSALYCFCFFGKTVKCLFDLFVNFVMQSRPTSTQLVLV